MDTSFLVPLLETKWALRPRQVRVVAEVVVEVAAEVAVGSMVDMNHRD
jgi:hypothetical protein